MKEFINHPAVTRIFKPEIEKYGIFSIKISEDDNFTISQSISNGLKVPIGLTNDIRYAAITAAYEDENAIDVHEETDTINAAIESRKNR